MCGVCIYLQVVLVSATCCFTLRNDQYRTVFVFLASEGIYNRLSFFYSTFAIYMAEVKRQHLQNATREG